MKQLQAMDFARVVSDKKIKDTGLTRGQTVLVMSQKQVPAKKTDPYLVRILTVVANAPEGVPEIPKADNDYKAYLIDPRNLEFVGEDEQKILTENLRTNYR